MKKEEFVKLGLTEEMAQKCETASLEELKGFIPKARFDEVNGEKKKYEQDVKDRDAQLEQLKASAGDVDGLKQQIATLQAENKAKGEEYAASIKRMKIDAAIEAALTGAKAKNNTAVKALLKDLDKAELDDAGAIKGLADQIKALQKAEDTKFLFAEESKPSLKGAVPAGTGAAAAHGITKEQFAKMGYAERVKLYETDIDTYKALTGAE